MDWMDLAPDSDGWWRALGNAVMNLRFPQNEGRFLNWLRNCYLLRKDSVLWSYLVSQSVSQSVSQLVS
jgi:hypothetical protein